MFEMLELVKEVSFLWAAPQEVIKNPRAGGVKPGVQTAEKSSPRGLITPESSPQMKCFPLTFFRSGKGSHIA